MKKITLLVGLTVSLMVSCGSHTPDGAGPSVNSAEKQQTYTLDYAWSRVKAKMEGKDYIRNPDFGNDVISEGQSYVMMMAVQMNDRALFDRVWNWSKWKMQHSDTGLFAWRVNPDTGQKVDPNSAPDGEAYFLTALIFAHNRWVGGSSSGYLSDAKGLQAAMKARLFVNGGTYNGMIKFTQVNAFTDPSYHLPAFFDVWAATAEKHSWGTRDFWRAAANTSRNFLTQATSKFRNGSGLTPDYANYDGSGRSESWNPRSNEFRYDARRTAMNWTMDFLWRGNQDATNLKASVLSRNILNFFNGQDGNPGDSNLSYNSLCRPDGFCEGGKQAGLIAMNAVASLSLLAHNPDDAMAKAFKNEIFYQDPTQYGYYDLVLHTLGMLWVTGNFKKYM